MYVVHGSDAQRFARSGCVVFLANLSPSPPQPSPRYLVFEICGENGDKLMALLDGLAFAYEANVTVVLPRGKPNLVGPHQWVLDELIDVDHLIASISGNITVVREYPRPMPHPLPRIDLS